MNKRVFFVSPEDLNIRMCQAKKLLDTDRVFLVSEKEDMPELTGKVNQFLENKNTFCMISSDEDLMALIEAECLETEDIYFIGHIVKRYYDSCKKAIIEMGHKIGYNNTFGIQKTILRGKNTQQSMFPIGDIMNAVNEKPKQENNKYNLEGGHIVPNISKQSTDKEKAKDKPKKESELSHTLQKSEDKINSKPLQNLKTETTEDPFRDLTIEKSNGEDINDAKAQLTYVLFVRLTNHIKQLIQKEYNKSTLYQFVILLRKTETCEEFQKSWKEICSDPSFKINEEAYWMLRNEATFYHQTCVYLYEGDLWTD